MPPNLPSFDTKELKMSINSSFYHHVLVWTAQTCWVRMCSSAVRLHWNPFWSMWEGHCCAVRCPSLTGKIPVQTKALDTPSHSMCILFFMIICIIDSHERHQKYEWTHMELQFVLKVWNDWKHFIYSSFFIVATLVPCALCFCPETSLGVWHIYSPSSMNSPLILRGGLIKATDVCVQLLTCGLCAAPRAGNKCRRNYRDQIRSS